MAENEHDVVFRLIVREGEGTKDVLSEFGQSHLEAQLGMTRAALDHTKRRVDIELAGHGRILNSMRSLAAERDRLFGKGVTGIGVGSPKAPPTSLPGIGPRQPATSVPTIVPRAGAPVARDVPTIVPPPVDHGPEIDGVKKARDEIGRLMQQSADTIAEIAKRNGQAEIDMAKLTAKERQAILQEMAVIEKAQRELGAKDDADGTRAVIADLKKQSAEADKSHKEEMKRLDEKQARLDEIAARSKRSDRASKDRDVAVAAATPTTGSFSEADADTRAQIIARVTKMVEAHHAAGRKESAATTKAVLDDLKMQDKAAEASLAKRKVALKEAISDAKKEADARQAAAIGAQAHFDQLVGQTAQGNRQMVQGALMTTQSIARLGRGFAMLGLLSEEETAKILKGLMKIQAGFDIFVGGVKLVQYLSTAYKGYRLAIDSAAAAQKIVNAGAAVAAVQSSAITTALNVEAAAASRATASHLALGRARTGGAAASSVTSGVGTAVGIGTAGGVAGGGAGAAGLVAALAPPIAILAGAAALIYAGGTAIRDAAKYGIGGGPTHDSGWDKLGTFAAGINANIDRATERWFGTTMQSLGRLTPMGGPAGQLADSQAAVYRTEKARAAKQEADERRKEQTDAIAEGRLGMFALQSQQRGAQDQEALFGIDDQEARLKKMIAQADARMDEADALGRAAKFDINGIARRPEDRMQEEQYARNAQMQAAKDSLDAARELQKLLKQKEPIRRERGQANELNVTEAQSIAKPLRNAAQLMAKDLADAMREVASESQGPFRSLSRTGSMDARLSILRRRGRDESTSAEVPPELAERQSRIAKMIEHQQTNLAALKGGAEDDDKRQQIEENILRLTMDRAKTEKEIAAIRLSASEQALDSIRTEMQMRRDAIEENKKLYADAMSNFGSKSIEEQRKILAAAKKATEAAAMGASNVDPSLAGKRDAATKKRVAAQEDLRLTSKDEIFKDMRTLLKDKDRTPQEEQRLEMLRGRLRTNRVNPKSAIEAYQESQKKKIAGFGQQETEIDTKVGGQQVQNLRQAGRLAEIDRRRRMGEQYVSDQDRQFEASIKDKEQLAGGMSMSREDSERLSFDSRYSGMSDRANYEKGRKAGGVGLIGVEQQEEAARHRQALERLGPQEAESDRDVRRRQAQSGIEASTVAALEARFNNNYEVNATFNISAADMAKQLANIVEQRQATYQKAMKDYFDKELGGRLDELYRKLEIINTTRNAKTGGMVGFYGQ